MVAAATHSLCEAANSLVQGNSSEEKLIAAAKQVCNVIFVYFFYRKEKTPYTDLDIQPSGSKKGGQQCFGSVFI
jgi:hypothetical protein